MVSHGNHPLNPSHYDDDTLERYILGQLPPEEAEDIRQHLQECVFCRRRTAEFQVLGQQIKADLHRALNKATPNSPLRFDPIAVEWRNPPARVRLMARIQRFFPGLSYIVLLALLILGFVLLIPSDSAAMMNNLELVRTYDGPPAVVAAATSDGLVILRLSDNTRQVVAHLDHLTHPLNLKFSPDGQWLSLQQGQILHVIETRTAGAHIQSTLAGSAGWAWSPDSQSLAYTDGAGRLALLDITSGTTRILVPAEEGAWGAPVWSAEGDQIAYAIADPLPDIGSPTRQSIWRVMPETGYRAELVRNPAPGETLLAPAAWADGNSVILAWDLNVKTAVNQPTLYRVDIEAHHIEQMRDSSFAQGEQLAWPVNSQGTALAVYQNQLVALNVNEGTREPISHQIPWPSVLDWSPNGAWAAYTIPGSPEGEGLCLYALREGVLRPIKLPDGAVEKAVFWAGAEHLFVIRQPQDKATSELWLVPLTIDQAPQRILTNARLPGVGGRWQDVLTAQVLSP
ncbi:MAG: zf-HC2 domain-containing protein [Anaerolineae bacterium]|nr:zf-HC2 domain-containing protein [Anaerolineae bacterium]